MMKNLTEYITEKLMIIPSQVNEKLVVNKDYMKYNYSPKTPEELRQIILDRYKEHGPGTKDEPIDFNDIDVSEMITFYNKHTGEGIFDETKFEYIDVSGWDVSKVEDMRYIFYNCKSLKELNISNWDISNVQKSQYMFYKCSDLEKLLLPDFSKIENIKMIDMFNGCNPNVIPNWYNK